MKEYKFEAKTQEEALLKASEELGINIRDMQYEVIEQDSKMFGLVKRVVVKVSVPDNIHGTEETVDEPEYLMEDPQEKKDDIGLGTMVETVLTRILELMGMDVSLTLQETDSEVLVDLKGKDIDHITGKDGRTLTSLQFLVNRIVNRKNENRKHVLIDADGYKERRDEELQIRAMKLAQKAIDSGNTMRMESMNSRDRRVVHLALKENKRVSTKSEGNGPNRRVLIIPKNRKNGGQRQTGGRKRGKKQAQSLPRDEQQNRANR